MAQPVYLKLTIDGNEVEGESSVDTLGRGNAIECVSFQCGVTTPRDAASGQPTGRRQYEPVRAQKRIDQSTPLILKALCEKASVEAEFRFFRRRADKGRSVEEHFYAVRLWNANIASVKQVSEATLMGGAPTPPPMEEIEFAFQEIEWTYEIGGVTYRDSRSGEHL